MDVLEPAALLAAFLCGAAFLLVVPGGPKRPRKVQPAAVQEPKAAPLIGVPPGWKP